MENKENSPAKPFKGILTNPAKDTVHQIVELIKQGDVDPARVGVGIKKFEKIAKLLKEDKGAWEIIEESIKQYQEGTKKSVQVHGSKVIIATRGFWDYSDTEDPVLEAYTEIEKKVKELKKNREEYIQNKSEEWEKMNKPTQEDGEGGVNFGIKPFILTFEHLPKLIFEDAVGEVNTNPAIKKGKEELRFYV